MRYIILLVAITLFSCTQATSSEQLETAFKNVIELCSTEKLPNSMARPEGVDLKQYLDEVHAKRIAAETIFFNNNGRSYLESKLASKPDELEQVCIQEMLQNAKEANKRL